MAYKIGYSNKAYGSRWTYQDANEVKEVVNRNAELLEQMGSNDYDESIAALQTTQKAQATQITDMQNKDAQQDNLLKNLDASLNPLKIALTGGGGVYKNGTVQTVTIAWTATKGDAEVVITPTVNGTTLAVGTRNYTEQVSATKTFVVTGTYTYNVMNGVTSTLTAEASTKVTFVDPIKFGFSDVKSGVDVNALAYEYVKASPNGTYTLRADANGYMWLCVPSTMTINKVTMSGFGVPLEAPQTIGSYKCYRSSNQLVAGSYTIVIS